MIRRDIKRRKLVYVYELDRLVLKERLYNCQLPREERLKAQIALSQFPRDSSKVRVRNRCVITGRGRGVERLFKMSRLALRDFASNGLLSGVIKASW